MTLMLFHFIMFLDNHTIHPGSLYFYFFFVFESVQPNTKCSSAINQLKRIKSGLYSECPGTYTSCLALFTQPQPLGKRDGWGIRDKLARGSKASFNSNPLRALLRCTVIVLTSQTPTTQPPHSSPNGLFVTLACHSFLFNNRELNLQRKSPL